MAGRVRRICLVNPKLEGPYPPLGLAYLASYLKTKDNYEIKIVDGNSVKNIIAQILQFEPQLLGFTALSQQIREAVKLSLALRELRPEILQVIGGIHVSAEPEETLRRGNFDLAVLGEGEETFSEIASIISASPKDKSLCFGIAGIAYLDNHNFRVNPCRKEIEDLDSIPPPARGLLDMRHYLSEYLMIRGLSGNRIATIHTSRGCPYNCIFCSCGIVFKKVRSFSIPYVILEIKELIERYKVKGLFFTDDTFIINKKRVSELCLTMIKEGLNKKIKWEVQGRANLIGWEDLDFLKLMKEAGCVQIDYGFESGSERILRLLKKDNTGIEYNKRAMEVTKKAGLNVMGTFMIGVPGESDEDIDLTRDFIVNNYKDIDNFQVFIATPFPGAQLYEICKDRGLVEKNYFNQLSKEEAASFQPFYSDTVSYEKVLRAQELLNRLALKKIKLREKLRWLCFNFLRHPFKTMQRVFSSL